jgi:signal peptidase I
MAESFKKSTIREYFESIVIAVILALFVRTFVVQAFKIPTGSMENNLLIGDHLLVNKFALAPVSSGIERTLLPIGTIKRGDVLVFKYPVEPDRDFIKRVIGLPGEALQLKDKKIYINGKPLDEPYVHFLEEPRRNAELAEVTSSDVRENYGPVTVPPNQYFMMGDNRDNSTDSRASWGVGYVPFENLIGRAEIIFFSAAVDEPDAFRWYAPWSWPFDIRWTRFFTLVR